MTTTYPIADMMIGVRNMIEATTRTLPFSVGPVRRVQRRWRSQR